MLVPAKLLPTTQTSAKTQLRFEKTWQSAVDNRLHTPRCRKKDVQFHQTSDDNAQYDRLRRHRAQQYGSGIQLRHISPAFRCAGPHMHELVMRRHAVHETFRKTCDHKIAPFARIPEPVTPNSPKRFPSWDRPHNTPACTQVLKEEATCNYTL